MSYYLDASVQINGEFEFYCQPAGIRIRPGPAQYLDGGMVRPTPQA
jgi:hypothetical protein